MSLKHRPKVYRDRVTGRWVVAIELTTGARMEMEYSSWRTGRGRGVVVFGLGGVMNGLDIAGLLRELARHADDPVKRAQYRAAAATHRTAGAMRRGGRYRTRSLPRAYALPRQPQPRCPVTGRFVKRSS